MSFVPLTNIAMSKIREVVNLQSSEPTIPSVNYTITDLYDNRANVIAPGMPSTVELLNISNWRGADVFSGVIVVEPEKITINLDTNGLSTGFIVVRLFSGEERRSRQKVPVGDTIEFIFDDIEPTEPIDFFEIQDSTTLTTLQINNNQATNITHSFTGLNIIST